MLAERQMLQPSLERLRVRNYGPINLTLVSRKVIVLVLTLLQCTRTQPEWTDQEQIMPDKPHHLL